MKSYIWNKPCHVAISCHGYRARGNMSANPTLLEGDEEADKLLRKGTAALLVGPEPFWSLGDMFFKGDIRKAVEVKGLQL